MDQKFVEEVDVAIRLVRRGELKALGELPQLRDLRAVQVHLLQPAERVAPAYIGAIIDSLIKATIAALKPSSDEDSDDHEWRKYILLDNYFVRGERWKTVADRLGLGRSRFYAVMSLAIEALALALFQGQPAVDFDVSTTPVVKHNLPRPMYQFVPRFDDHGQDFIDRAIQGLMRRPWVASIRGFSGAGKTTLALEVAERCREKSYFDVIIWIAARTEKEGFVTSLETMCNIIAQVFNDQRVVAAEDLQEKQDLAIKNLASVQRCLLIIDNTEVLSDEQHQEIYDFIQQMPMSTSVLLTSRERGRASELETVIKLFGMKAEESLTFMQNVCRSRGMSPTEEDLYHIYEATSGIPSAMHLAIGLMTEGYMAQEAVRSEIGPVDDLLKYLLEESYDRLSLPEKKMLHVMPIFHNPVPTSVIAIASDVEGVHFRVGLDRLNTRFLLRQHDGPVFDILAPTRKFLEQRIHDAIALLEPEPGLVSLETPYRNLANGYPAIIRDLDRNKKRQFIREQWENILAVMEWCYENKEPLLASLLDLMGYWLGLLGYKRERVKWGKLTVNLLKERGKIEVAAYHLVHDVGWTHFQQGQAELAKDCFQDGLDLAGANPSLVRGIALRNLGYLARENENLDEAERLYEEALSIFESLAEERWIGICSGGLGVLMLLQNNITKAEHYLLKAQTLNEKLDEFEGVASSTSDLARVALEQEDFDKVETLLSKSLQLAYDHELPEEEAYAKVWLARLRERQGRVQEAFELAEEACRIFERVGLGTPFVHKVKQLRDQLQNAPAADFR